MSVQHTATVLEHIPIGDGRRTALRTSIPHSFNYTPGQYTLINLGDSEPDSNSLARYASIASAPHEDSLLFVMNSGSSVFKKRYSQLSKGQTVSLTEPGGSLFQSVPHASQNIYIVGGVGVTPVRSILLHQLTTGYSTPSHLLYSARSSQECLFYDLFQEMSQTHATFQFTPTFTQVPPTEIALTGRIDDEMIKNHVENIDDAHYYIVGSHPFIRSIQHSLKSLGMTPHQWSIEVFCGYCPDHQCCCDHIGH